MATATFAWQTWNSGPFSIERAHGSAPGTVILRFHGPFTVRDAYTNLPPLHAEQDARPGARPRARSPPSRTSSTSRTAPTSIQAASASSLLITSAARRKASD